MQIDLRGEEKRRLIAHLFNSVHSLTWRRLIAFILSCGRVCFDAEKQTRQQTILSLRTNLFF